MGEEVSESVLEFIFNHRWTQINLISNAYFALFHQNRRSSVFICGESRFIKHSLRGQVRGVGESRAVVRIKLMPTITS